MRGKRLSICALENWRIQELLRKEDGIPRVTAIKVVATIQGQNGH